MIRYGSFGFVTVVTFVRLVTVVTVVTVVPLVRPEFVGFRVTRKTRELIFS